MRRLVQPNFAASRKLDLCNRSPSFFVDSRASDAFSRQDLHLGLKVFTHEIEFVAIVFFGRMEGCFGWRESEDQPAVTSVDGSHSQHIAKEDAVGLGVLAVDDDVCTRNHGGSSLAPPS